MAVDFSAVLASLRADGDGFTVAVPSDWLQGRTVFGGMQVALAVRAMRNVMTDESRARPLRTAQATFVGPIPGEVNVRVRAEVLRVGRSTTHARCDLVHDNVVACSVTAIFGSALTAQFVHELARPDPGVRPADCAEAAVDRRFALSFLRHLELRWVRGGKPYTGQSEPGSMIYVRLRDRQSEPEAALIALADSIPTPVLSMLRQPRPASSLNWMLEVLRDPARLDLHEHVLIDTDMRAGTDGYVSQTSVLYGADGHAYSVSHQTVGVFA